MITYDYIIEAQRALVECWGDSGKRIIEAAAASIPYNEKFSVFLEKECTACGGNWGGMLLTGVKRVYPDVWELIPNEMGINAWACICYTLLLLGVDTSAED